MLYGSMALTNAWGHVSTIMVSHSFTALRIPCSSCLYPSLQTLATTDLFAVSLVLSLPECHMLIVGIIEYQAFSDWLLSLSKIKVCGSIAHFFVLLNNISSHRVDLKPETDAFPCTTHCQISRLSPYFFTFWWTCWLLLFFFFSIMSKACSLRL